jgi:NADPH:quinone reductase-like Zn-dependent oxidoreductase
MADRMRVMSQQALGGPDVMRLAQVARPDPGPTEIRVRVLAAGVNPVDWKTRATGGFLGEPPFVLGWDVSGVVDRVGFGVSWLASGDEVFGMPRFPRQAGGYGEFVVAPSRQFTTKPTGLSHVEAAGLPLAGLAAWQALVDTADVRAGQRVLVHAAAGGVGHLAVQIAKAKGAEVIGTARSPKHAFLRSLGVDQAIDYTDTAVGEAVRNIDVALDLVGDDSGIRLLPALRPDGLLIVVPGGLRKVAAEARERGVRAVGMLVEPDPVGLRGLAELVQAGRLRPEISHEFELADAAAAHRLGEIGRTTGKIVLTVVS